MNLKEGLRVLCAYTAGHFDFCSLAGDAKRMRRKHVMEALLGQKMPTARCGITAMRQTFHEALGVRRDSIARENDEFIAKARETLGQAHKSEHTTRFAAGAATQGAEEKL